MSIVLLSLKDLHTRRNHGHGTQVLIRWHCYFDNSNLAMRSHSIHTHFNYSPHPLSTLFLSAILLGLVVTQILMRKPFQEDTVC